MQLWKLVLSAFVASWLRAGMHRSSFTKASKLKTYYKESASIININYVNVITDSVCKAKKERVKMLLSQSLLCLSGTYFMFFSWNCIFQKLRPPFKATLLYWQPFLNILKEVHIAFSKEGKGVQFGKGLPKTTRLSVEI